MIDTMINTWNPYNCFMTFLWSRAASFTYCGLRNGYGYRDTVQDIQGVIHLAPEMAKDKIRFMLSAQTAKGAGLPLVKFTHNAGHENTPDDPEYVKRPGIRLTVRMMHSGCSRPSINISRRPAIWTLSMR